MKKFACLLILALILMPLGVLAADFNSTITPEDQSTFDQILQPIMKIYNFVKYAASVIAVLFLIFAGVTFIMSGNDQAKREQAKMTMTYIVIGLIVIWVAPLIVSYLVK